MAEDEQEVQADEIDEIGRRMADVIEEQDEQVSEHVTPHWELFYDDDHDDAERIVHLHGDEKMPAQVTAHSDGGSMAVCTQCNATLEISQATRSRRDGSESASAASASGSADNGVSG